MLTVWSLGASPSRQDMMEMASLGSYNGLHAGTGELRLRMGERQH